VADVAALLSTDVLPGLPEDVPDPPPPPHPESKSIKAREITLGKRKFLTINCMATSFLDDLLSFQREVYPHHK
jgi:hypothetical protein